MTVGSVPGKRHAIANAVFAGQLHHLPALLIAILVIAQHIGPQNGGALSHAAFDDGIDGKEAAAGIGIHPGLRATVEDYDVGTLNGAGENQTEPEMIESHALGQFTQQGHYGALICRRLKLGYEIQRMQGVHL